MEKRIAVRGKTRMRKVSVQVERGAVDRLMEVWPGLSRSECIRLAVERMLYLHRMEANK